ncbi:MAG: acyl-CoA dehydrogenase family protein [Chloroflexi bacterium]|nr:acyl-CoA dehydrogenase family protein [Chloroflexota bacterium]
MSDPLLSEEERMLQRTVREFADRELVPRARELDEAERFPWENLKGLASLGLMGLTVDPRYGGSGGGYRELAIATEEVARGCAGTSVCFIAHLSLGTSTIARFGTEGQKERFLPPLARGEELCAWALTEPGNGSDAAALQCTATPRGGRYLLNGAKTFITNGDLANTVVVFATQDPSLRHRGVGVFVVEKGSPGFTANPQHGKMGMRASSTAELVFDDCPVPAENRLGAEGEGFRIAMQVLDSSRIIIAAQSVGIGQAAFEAAVRYSQQRVTFGKPLAEHQAIQFMIADMATQLDAARLLVRRAATLKDQDLPHGQESAMAKLFASEAAHFACDRALQVHGGYGYFKESPVERHYRDQRVVEIYEGSSEVQRIVIARGVLKAMPV